MGATRKSTRKLSGLAEVFCTLIGGVLTYCVYYTHGATDSKCSISLYVNYNSIHKENNNKKMNAESCAA
jgi:hypothetical protein